VPWPADILEHRSLPDGDRFRRNSRPLQAAVGLVPAIQARRQKEADLDSVPPLAKAGISANGLVVFLRRLQANPYLSEPSQYLSSHPALLDRANGLQQEVRKMAVPAGSFMAAEQ
jgi:predicted Zn-dependent protease